MKNFLHALWQFVSYLFWPQWGKKRREDYTNGTTKNGRPPDHHQHLS